MKIFSCEVCETPTVRKIKMVATNGKSWFSQDGWALCSTECERRKAKRIMNEKKEKTASATG